MAAPVADAPRAVCEVAPQVLDVARPAGALVFRIELTPAPGRIEPPAAGTIAPGVFVASVSGVKLPEPSRREEGIGERVAARRIEDRVAAGRGAPYPNGVPELVVTFDRPSDGDPATLEDGDAGDVLAMLLDVPDGRSVPICIAGRVDGASFECCATLEVHNRGLRDRPRFLSPASRP